MKCYLCNNTILNKVKGTVRDKPSILILKCIDCGLVQLDYTPPNKYYEEGNMNDFDTLEAYIRSCEDNDLFRAKMWSTSFVGKKVLDFGCGLGGFIRELKDKKVNILGIDVDPTWKKINPNLEIFDDISKLNKKFDFITLFHVLEHLKDPKKILKMVSTKLENDGEIIIEVPNANDALLTYYDCEAFQKFTYWSAHLFLFSQETLKILFEQSKLKVNYIKHIQRYPLSNHLYWLKYGKPNGHRIWGRLNNKKLNKIYELTLSDLRITDTIVASVSKGDK